MCIRERFQGALPAPARLQGVWQALLYGVLLLALLLGLAGGALPGMRFAVAALGLMFALGGLLLQSRAAKLRNAPLTWFWRSGLLAVSYTHLDVYKRQRMKLPGTVPPKVQKV